MSFGRTISGEIDLEVDDLLVNNMDVLEETVVNDLTITGSTTVGGPVTAANISCSTITVGNSAVLAYVNPNQAVQTDATGVLVTVSNTGSGSNVLATSPTLVTPNIGDATGTSLNVTGNIVCDNVDTNLTANQSVQTTTGGLLATVANTGSGLNVLQTSPSLTTPNIGAATGTSLNVSGNVTCATVDTTLTGNQAVQTGATGILTTIANTGSGSNVLATSPTLVTPNIGAATGTSLNVSGNVTCATVDTTLTGNQAVQTDATGILTTVANTGSGSNVLATSPTLVSPNIGAASGISLTVTGNISCSTIDTSLAANQSVQTTTGGVLTTVTNTGGGLNVLQTSPSLVTPDIGAATGTSLTTTGDVTVGGAISAATYTTALTASRSVRTNSLSQLTTVSDTGSGLNVLQTNPSLTTPNIGAATGTSLSVTGNVSCATVDTTLTGNQAVQTDASGILTTIANTGSGSNVLQTSPTLVTPNIGAASGTSLSLSGTLSCSSIDTTLTGNQAVQTDASGILTTVANTGSGLNVLQTSPTLVTPNIGAATGTSLSTTGDITAAGILKSTNVNDATSTLSGAIRSSGGIGCVKSIFAGGDVTATKIISTDTGDATALGTGAITTPGGLSVTRKIRAGDNITTQYGNVECLNGYFDYRGTLLNFAGAPLVPYMDKMLPSDPAMPAISYIEQGGWIQNCGYMTMIAIKIKYTQPAGLFSIRAAIGGIPNQYYVGGCGMMEPGLGSYIENSGGGGFDKTPLTMIAWDPTYQKMGIYYYDLATKNYQALTYGSTSIGATQGIYVTAVFERTTL